MGMKTYGVHYVTVPVQGGHLESRFLTEDFFTQAPVADISVPSWISEDVRDAESAPDARPLGIRAFAQLLWDEEAFYVRLWAEEARVRREEHGPLGMPCEDSCLEFFFAPCPPDRRYFNLEFNPNACLYLGIGSSIRDLTRLVPENAEELFCPEVRMTEGGWEIRYRVPFSFVRRFFPDFRPHPGMKLRGNFYKCGDLTEREHYLSWNPISVIPVSFHRPDDFGELVLEGPGGAVK
ncbi:MAG: carbohydrate-binding family 9-like protein [Lachnospiraceae bacterium]|nr:carbohydrate-binding family 9-like protein [Lachnospiraceae bacterium]